MTDSQISAPQSLPACRYAAVLFDLDGTLLDTAPDFVTAINRLLSDRGLAPHSEAQVRRAVTHGSAGLIERTFNLVPEHPDFEPLRQQLLAYYRGCLVEKTRLFDGMETVLTYLAQAGTPWGIVTNKPEQYTSAILAGLTFPALPAAVICPDHVTLTKPDPESILLACQQLSVDPEQVLYVGDHARDIMAGRNAGADTAAVSYGYLDPDEDCAAWGADYQVAHPLELLDIVFAN
ncbi:MAG: phosphoglycolate phosphatase [Porticoccaceae bacterium]|nr:phosphoglycolate phosphatase [Porticoccaceae bacterium]